MNILRRTVMALGGMALVALVIALVVPKAAHGVVATLVQVVNTSSNPVQTTDTFRSTGQTIELFCWQNLSTGYLVCGQVSTKGMDPNNIQPPQYTVPAGQNFVVTTIDVIFYSSAPDLYPLILEEVDPQQPSFYGFREAFSIKGGPSVQFQYPVAGIVIGPGLQPIMFGPAQYVTIRGYLTSN